MTYYKWLTPDMTSHHDPTYVWRVGDIQRAAQWDSPEAGARGRGLHLLKRPVDALRFGRWPGRLFEAEPVGGAIAEDAEKVRCAAARLTRELDPAQAFGPSGARVIDFLSRLEDVPWLKASQSPSAAQAAAMEYQARLAPWGWRSVPVKVRPFEDLKAAAATAEGSIRPSLQVGAGAAWSAAGIPWAMWATPWAAWSAWGTVWEDVEAVAGGAAWNMARRSWEGIPPWPSPHDAMWQEVAHSVRAAVRVVAGSAAVDAVRAAEYLVCSHSLPPDPFEPLMDVWRLGYWPMGLVDGRYLVGDLSSLTRGEEPENMG